LLLCLLVELDITIEVLASALAYVLAATFNYFANYHLTFASKQAHRKTLPKFIVTATLGLGMNTLIFAAMFYMTTYYLIAQLCATGCTLVINFLLHKFWIYRNPT
jgi:putative flippase GtrA